MDSDNPPSYKEQNGSVPKYGATDDEGVYDKLKRASRESVDNRTFARNVSSIIMTSVLLTSILAFLLVLPVTAIVIGALHLDECPIEKNMIPVWSLVLGAIGVLLLVLLLIQQFYLRRFSLENKDSWEKMESANDAFSFVNIIIFMFLVFWFVYGNLLIFRTWHKVSYETGEKDFCDKQMYRFALVLINVVDIVTGMLCCFCCLIALCAIAACFTVTEEQWAQTDQPPSQPQPQPRSSRHQSQEKPIPAIKQTQVSQQQRTSTEIPEKTNDNENKCESQSPHDKPEDTNPNPPAYISAEEKSSKKSKSEIRTAASETVSSEKEDEKVDDEAAE
jgi:hypothetical protein